MLTTNYKSHLKQSNRLSPVRRCWSYKVPMALCIGHCHWGKDKKANILITDQKKQLHILDVKGDLIDILQLPAKFFQIDCGQHKTDGFRVLGNSKAKLYVMDCAGNVLWQYSKWLGFITIDNAHWGDLNSDGEDEIVLGMNGWESLITLTGEGKPFWKITTIHNVWDHTILPQTPNNPPQVLATEASGAIKVYSQDGKLLRTLRPEGLYFSKLTAAIVKSPNLVQIAAIGIGHGEQAYKVLVFNPDGKVIWKTPTYAYGHVLIERTFACEDINGDGIREWVFAETPHELVCASIQGEKLASLAISENIKDFLIIPDSEGYGMIAVLEGETVSTYQLAE